MIIERLTDLLDHFEGELPCNIYYDDGKECILLCITSIDAIIDNDGKIELINIHLAQ